MGAGRLRVRGACWPLTRLRLCPSVPCAPLSVRAPSGPDCCRSWCMPCRCSTSPLLLTHALSRFLSRLQGDAMCLLCLRPPLPVSAGRAPAPRCSAQQASFPVLLAARFPTFSLFAVCSSSPASLKSGRGCGRAWPGCGGTPVGEECLHGAGSRPPGLWRQQRTPVPVQFPYVLVSMPHANP